MSGRTTVVLFVILLLLGGFLLWQNQGEETVEVTPEPTPAPAFVLMLDDYEMADLRRLRISRPASGETLDYRYDPNEEEPWQLADGGSRFRGGMALDVHVPAFFGLRYTRALSVTAETSLADFGLDPPQYEIMLELVGENGRMQTYTYAIGQRTINNLAYYAQQEGIPDTIYIIPSGFISNITNILDDPILPLE
jgi:hypothetical protein